MQIKMIFLALLLASCSLKPYKMDIHQGNVITAEMREKLKLGMSKQQVRYVLGTPLISDAFHGNRWDYVYRHEQGGKVIEQQGLTLNFLDNSLQSIDDGKQLIQADPIAPKPPLVIATANEPEAMSSPPIMAKSMAVVAPVDSTVDVTEAVQAWADAWSAKDAEQYFASYADSFKPSGMSKSAWQAQREARMSKSKSIAVALSDLKVKLSDDSHASATFVQNYRADSYQDKTRKILQLEKIDEAWLIVSEQLMK
ncbi:MAG: outer membrane protein assembly factor BamE [Gallionella sp.]|nr:outer membrane protein assembly factor BamE [Gallionella sp.]